MATKGVVRIAGHCAARHDCFRLGASTSRPSAASAPAGGLGSPSHQNMVATTHTKCSQPIWTNSVRWIGCDRRAFGKFNATGGWLFPASTGTERVLQPSSDSRRRRRVSRSAVGSGASRFASRARTARGRHTLASEEPDRSSRAARSSWSAVVAVVFACDGRRPLNAIAGAENHLGAIRELSMHGLLLASKA